MSRCNTYNTAMMDVCLHTGESDLPVLMASHCGSVYTCECEPNVHVWRSCWCISLLAFLAVWSLVQVCVQVCVKVSFRCVQVCLQVCLQVCTGACRCVFRHIVCWLFAVWDVLFICWSKTQCLIRFCLLFHQT